MTARIPVDELGLGQLDTISIGTEWSRDDEEGESRWQFWEAFEYEIGDQTWYGIANDGSVVAAYSPLGRRVETPGRSTVLGELFDCSPYEHGAEGPMMNYRYPLLGDRRDSVGSYGHSCDTVEAAYRLRDTPLCVVEYDDDMALALTGGGMDLTWEIVEAFTRLGNLPPVALCSLPGMAGRGASERDRYLIAACERALARKADGLRSDLKRHRQRWSSQTHEGSAR